MTFKCYQSTCVQCYMSQPTRVIYRAALSVTSVAGLDTLLVTAWMESRVVAAEVAETQTMAAGEVLINIMFSCWHHLTSFLSVCVCV